MNFAEQQTQQLTQDYLAKTGWGLDHYVQGDMRGPLLYFKDVESGYLQLVTILPETFEMGLLDPSALSDAVMTINVLVTALTDPHPELPHFDEPKAKLAQLLSAYAINTQTVKQTVSKLGYDCSVFVMRYFDQEYQEYCLRPFATRHTQLKTPEEVTRLFDQALAMDMEVYPQRFKLC